MSLLVPVRVVLVPGVLFLVFRMSCGLENDGPPVILRVTKPIVLQWATLSLRRKQVVPDLCLVKTVISMPVFAILDWFDDRMRTVVCRTMCRNVVAGIVLDFLMLATSAERLLLTKLASRWCSLFRLMP